MVTVQGEGGRHDSASALLFDDPLRYMIVKSYSWIARDHLQSMPSIFCADSHCSGA